jgi:hexosaminidase
MHLGGDEVPEGVWLGSPACEKLELTNDAGMKRGQQLQLHFLDRASDVVRQHGLQPACWEDCLLFGPKEGPFVGETRATGSAPRPTAYVWNNVWGWGREDAAYRLANAGYDVVLANATNLYFDLAQEKHPQEPGYYWAGFVGLKQPFEFNPLDVFQNASHDLLGHALDPAQFRNRVHLTDAGRSHILGIQGAFWSENLRSPERLEYMAFPRMIALAERAWAKEPEWSNDGDAHARRERLAHDWNEFSNRLSQRELARLDYLDGGVRYRIAPPGVDVRDDRIRANTAYPGFSIRYTADGSEPTSASALYHDEISGQGEVKLRTFSASGQGSRSVTVGPPHN